MNERFEALVAAAVVTGALTLGGCGSDSSTKTEAGDDTAPTLVSAETLNPQTIQLTFSEDVKSSDDALLPGMFALHGVDENYGVDSNRYCTSFYTVSPYPHYLYTCSFSQGQPWIDYVSYYDLGQFVSAEIDSGSPDEVRLYRQFPIPPANGGTGFLRLTYQPASGGLKDNAGNTVSGIFPPSSVPGNVVDTVGQPAIIDARTINSNAVQLTFNKPLHTSNVTAVANDFTLRGNSFQSSGFCFSVYSVYAPSCAARFIAGSPFLFLDSFTPGTLTSQGLVMTLWTQNPISSGEDNGTGYLRLQYSGAGNAEALRDDQGNPLNNFFSNNQRQGTVIDTL